MSKEELRDACLPLMRCKTLEDCLKLIDVFRDFIFDVILSEKDKEPKSRDEDDAQVLLQMMLSKLIHIRKLLEGVVLAP